MKKRRKNIIKLTLNSERYDGNNMWNIIMKQISILILLIVVLFTTYSCQTSKTSYIGDYLNRKDYRLFVLSEDSTYKYRKDYSRKYSVGKWNVDGNKIILNSDIQEKKVTIDIKVTPSNQKYTSLNVNLNVPERDNENYICTPILNNNVFNTMFYYKYRGSYSASYEMNINSIGFEIKRSPLAFEVLGQRQPEYYTIYSEPEKIQSKQGDIIDVNLTLPDSLFSYQIFTNIKIKIKGNSLYFKDPEKRKTYKFERSRSRNDERNIRHLKMR